MKKINIIITIIFMLLLCGNINAHCAEKDGYEYTLIDGEVTIIGYRGEPESITIPEFVESCPVTEIRDNAFYNCHSLKHISIPDTVLKIGHHSFYACYSLEEIKLPPDLEEIGMGCFCGCAGLVSADLPETLTVLPDSCFRACTSLTEVILPRRLSVIEKFCFSGCTSLRSAETGESLTAVGERAFYMCNRLDSIYLPPSCCTVGRQALGYTCDGNMMLRQTEMLISGEKGSAAESYAAENGLPFEETAVEAFRSIELIEKDDRERDIFCKFGLLVFAVLTVVAVKFIIGKRSGHE